MSSNKLGFTIWFTGLSGSGKSTLAKGVKEYLDTLGYVSICLDGDDTRVGINKDLGFSVEDRVENIRRASEIAKLLSNNGIIVLASFITPFDSLRALAKSIIGKNFTLIYVNSSFDTCLKRDTKGLYEKAINKEIDNFTGISSAFEEPKNAEITIDTQNLTIKESLEAIIESINHLFPLGLNHYS